MKIGVVVFPGSNCDHDIEHVFSRVLGGTVSELWHKDREIGKQDVIVVPGGFSYGDYLRTGALAKLSPIMDGVRRFAQAGGPVIGICNGFQILCEAGLLPGALLQNVGMRFLSQFVHVRVENSNTPFTRALNQGSVVTCPIAHGEGNYYASEEELNQLEGDGQVVFRYCDRQGEAEYLNLTQNPNGSARGIAGISNKQGNVVGMMPHPERSSEAIVGLVGGASGRPIFDSVMA